MASSTLKLRRRMIWILIICAVAFVAMIALASFTRFWLLIGASIAPMMFGVAALVTLICLFIRDWNVYRVLMLVTIAVTWIGSVLLTAGVLLDVLMNRGINTQFIWRLSQLLVLIGGTFLLAAIVPTQWGLLALPRIERPIGVFARLFAQLLALACIGLWIVELWASEVDMYYSLLAFIGLICAIGMVCRLRDQERARANCVSIYAILVLAAFAGLTVSQWSLVQLLGEVYIGSADYARWRDEMTGIVTCVAVLVTVLVPALALLEYISRKEEPGSLVAAAIRVNIECPRCQSRQSIVTGSDACAACGLKFKLEIEEPRCACGYLLYQLHEGKCPECGRMISFAESPRSQTMPDVERMN